MLYERSRWILWMPVGLAIGIGAYFYVPHEPEGHWLLYTFLFLGSLCAFKGIRMWVIPFSLIAFGFCVAWLKTSLINTPQLSDETHPVFIEGTIDKIDQRPKDVRLTLKDVSYSKDVTQVHVVRLTCKGSMARSETLEPGGRVRVRAVLLPPQEPSHPYGYHFRRQAYFEGLGAVGYCLSKPLLLAQEKEKAWLNKLRYRLTQFLRVSIKGVEGEIAAALVTGDRSGIPQSVRDAYADAGIAHVLAISGLHLSLVAGFFFVFLRFFMALIPSLALRYPIKKIAAICALGGVMVYLVICSAPIPALRSFIMTSLILGGVVFDRFALSLRNVALAATGILLILPESLLSPSFQLFFAAVIMLVAGYERYYGPFHAWVAKNPWWGKSFVMYVCGILLSTLLSTVATTPYVVYTFHHFTLQSIPANMVVIPLVSFFIMPMLSLYILFWPLTKVLGFASLLHELLGLMNQVAASVALWKGSHIALKAMPLSSLVLLTFGLLAFFLIKHTFRYGGIVLILIGLGVMYISPIPSVFISKNGGLIGVYDSETGLWVNTLVKERFARTSWMSYCGAATVRKDPQLLEKIRL